MLVRHGELKTICCVVINQHQNLQTRSNKDYTIFFFYFFFNNFFFLFNNYYYYYYYLLIKERKKKKYKKYVKYTIHQLKPKKYVVPAETLSPSAETVSTSSNEDPTAAKMVRIQIIQQQLSLPLGLCLPSISAPDKNYSWVPNMNLSSEFSMNNLLRV